MVTGLLKHLLGTNWIEFLRGLVKQLGSNGSFGENRIFLTRLLSTVILIYTLDSVDPFSDVQDNELPIPSTVERTLSNQRENLSP